MVELFQDDDNVNWVPRSCDSTCDKLQSIPKHRGKIIRGQKSVDMYCFSYI